MKRILLVMIAAILLLPSFAQVNFGLRAGYNSSLTLQNINEVANGEYTLQNVGDELWNNFQAGAFLRLGIKNFYIQPEVLYNIQNKNYQITLQDALHNDVTIDKFVKIGTVDIPVLIGYKILDLEFANVRAFIGPKFRLNAGSSLDVNNISSFTGAQFAQDIKDSQVGLELGAGVDLFMFTLDARMDLIGNIVNDNLSDVVNQALPQLNDNTFIISLGWKF